MSQRAGHRRRGLPPMAVGVSPPADKRFRRPDQRPARRRRAIQYAVRGAAGVALLAVVAFAGVWLARAILDSSWLRVNHLVVSGTARLSPANIEALLVGMRRQSILRVDFEQYRRRVLDSPWVADVTLWRRLPSTVEVHVRERTPLAVARINQQLHLVDAEGMIIDEFGPEYADFDLPIVSGLMAPAGGDGPLVDPERVNLAHQFLQALDAWPAMRDRLAEIDVSAPRDVVVSLEGDPALLHLGDRRFVERLKTYLELGPSLRKELGEMDSVDLRFDERVFVKPRDKRSTK